MKSPVLQGTMPVAILVAAWGYMSGCALQKGNPGFHGGHRIRIERQFLEDVDWARVGANFNGTMFEVCSVRWGASSVRLLGFEPFIQSQYHDMSKHQHFLLLRADARMQCFLAVQRTKSGLRIKKYILHEPFTVKGQPSWQEILEDAKRSAGGFMTVDEKTIYVDDSFADILNERGVTLPVGVRILGHQGESAARDNRDQASDLVGESQ